VPNLFPPPLLIRFFRLRVNEVFFIFSPLSLDTSSLCFLRSANLRLLPMWLTSESCKVGTLGSFLCWTGAFPLPSLLSFQISALSSGFLSNNLPGCFFFFIIVLGESFPGPLPLRISFFFLILSGALSTPSQPLCLHQPVEETISPIAFVV